MSNKKKLLILGANHETIPLVRTAIEMGVHTIVTDQMPGSPAKAVADEAWDVNGLDVESLYQRARVQAVDGVMVGVADRLVVSAAELSEKLNLPTPAPTAACRILSRKDDFNRVCEKFGVGTIPRVDESTLPSTGSLPFRCFVKPVDSNSGKGMAICSTREELDRARDNALAVSGSRQILVERCMDCDDTAVHLTIQDGVVHVSAVVDRFTTRENPFGSRVCIGAVYPSRHLDLYRKSVHPQIIDMLRDLGVRSGVLTMQAFVEDGKFYIYDPGFRLQGEGCDHHFLKATGFNQREALVNYALSGRLRMTNDTPIREWPSTAACAATIWILAREGGVAKIHGLDEIRKLPEVFHVAQRLVEGDVVTPEMVGTERQVLARVYVAAHTATELASAIKHVEGSVTAFNWLGGNTLMAMTLSEVLMQRA